MEGRGVKLFWMGLLFTQALVGCGARDGAALPTRPIIAIEHRQPHCSNCPEFRVEFSVAQADFVCIGGCTVLGMVQEEMPATEYESLMAAFREARFMQMNREYFTCVDCGVTLLALTDRDRKHEVGFSGQPPTPELERLVARLAASSARFERFMKPEVESYRSLLADRWDVNGRYGNERETMLTSAVRAMKVESVRFLLSRGAEIDPDAWNHAAVGPAEILSGLLSSAKLDPRSLTAERVLRQAATQYRAENLPLLVNARISVNAADPETGETALMMAAAAGSRDNANLSLLLTKGAAVDAIDSRGRTALMHAARSCQSSSIPPLLKAGANAGLRDKGGRTAAEQVPSGLPNAVSACDVTRKVF
jgi:hypothetical protein